MDKKHAVDLELVVANPSTKVEFCDVLLDAVVEYLQPKIANLLGPGFKCHRMVAGRADVGMSQRPSRTGDEQIFAIGDHLTGHLHFPVRTFGEIVDNVVGRRGDHVGTVRGGELSLVEKCIHFKIGGAIARALYLAIPKASSMFDPYGLAIGPEVYFSSGSASFETPAFYDGSWMNLSFAIQGKHSKGIVTIFLPTLEILQKSEIPMKYSSLRSLCESRVPMGKDVLNSVLEKRIHQRVAALGVPSYLSLIEREPDEIMAACLQLVPDTVTSQVLQNLTPERAKIVIWHMVHLRRPRPLLLSILCEVLGERVSDYVRSQRIQRLEDMRMRGTRRW